MGNQYFNTRVLLFGEPPFALLYLKKDRWVGIDLFLIRPEPKFSGVKNAKLSDRKLIVDGKTYDIIIDN